LVPRILVNVYCLTYNSNFSDDYSIVVFFCMCGHQGFLFFLFVFFNSNFVISKKLVKVFEKLAKLVKFTLKKHLYQKFPNFLVKNTTKVVRKKSIAPITTYLVSHGCIFVCPKLPIFSLKHKERSKMRFA
jgi:Fe2+ transport system protein B